MPPRRLKLPMSRVFSAFIGNGFGDQPSDPVIERTVQVLR
jgi:hypothetical protein